MSENPPVSATIDVLGNTYTKTSQRQNREKEVKKYCFTLNNYTEEEYKELKIRLNPLGNWILGKEVGESGTPHIQGFILLSKKKSWSSFVKHVNNNRLHIEQCKGSTEQNVNYCSKDNNFESNFVEKKYIEEIDELYPWEIEINNILSTPPDKRTLYYYFEPDGCKGKTTYQKYVYTHFDKCIILSGKGADMKNGIISYFNANKFLPQIVLINIPRDAKDFVSWTGIEEIKDMMFYSGKYEGGCICGKCPHVIMFSNSPPPINKVSADRWKVFEIKNNVAIEWLIDSDDDEV